MSAPMIWVRHENGQEKPISLMSWNLLANKTERGTTRKGWTKIAGPTKSDVKAEVPTGPSVAFIPPEVTEEQHRARLAHETAMISGEAQAAEPVAPAKPAEGPAPVSDPSAEAPAEAVVNDPPVTEPPVKRDPLHTMPSMTARVAEVLNGIGINTYADLAKAETSVINKALETSGLAPKRAQVPGWKMKAAELASTPAK